MLKARTYDDPPKSYQSQYFKNLQDDFIRQYGEVKGTRLAKRFYRIRNLGDPKFEEEKIKIMYGLA